MNQDLRRSTSVNARMSWAERRRLAAVAPDGCLSAAVRQAIKIFIEIEEQNRSQG